MLLTFGTVTMHVDMDERHASLLLDLKADADGYELDEADAMAWLTAQGARGLVPGRINPRDLFTAAVTWSSSHDCPAGGCTECASLASEGRLIAEARATVNATEEALEAFLDDIRPDDDI